MNWNLKATAWWAAALPLSSLYDVQYWSVQQPWVSKWAQSYQPQAIIPHSDNVLVCLANLLSELSLHKQWQTQQLLDTR